MNMKKRSHMELYKKYRPTKLKDMVGQDSAVAILKSFLAKKKVPHTLLFSGPSGCGKTTFARIMRRKLKCGKYDFTELDCADFRGIDMVRSIKARVNQAPISGRCRVWLIDECHKLTIDAQNSFLKLLEDTPKHVYFMLATTDPQKLKKTIRNRCTEIAVKSLDFIQMTTLLSIVIQAEGKKVTQKVMDKIGEYSEGSARKALVLLNQVIDLSKEKEMLEAIEPTVVEVQSILIARALFKPKTRWKEVAALLKKLASEDPESIRWMILGYAKAVLLGGSPLSSRAYYIITIFGDHFYDSKHAGLVAACYEVVTTVDK